MQNFVRPFEYVILAWTDGKLSVTSCLLKIPAAGGICGLDQLGIVLETLLRAHLQELRQQKSDLSYTGFAWAGVKPHCDHTAVGSSSR
jgi:hypothetical protein